MHIWLLFPGAAVLDRLGVERVKTGHQLKSLHGGTDSTSTEPVVAVYESGEEYEVDAVIGADGLHSVVRREFYTDKPKFTGWICWRGATVMPPVWVIPAPSFPRARTGLALISASFCAVGSGLA